MAHAPSPCYVPRTASRPSSPALAPPHPIHARSSSTSRIETSLTPRMSSGAMERSATNGLRKEVVHEARRAAGVDEAARAILKLLSALPEPLPEALPPTFLPTPSASPPSSYPSPVSSFSTYVHAKRKRSSSPSSSSSSDEASSQSGIIGLGLGLSVSPESKRRKTDHNNKSGNAATAHGTSFPVGDRGLTPQGLASPTGPQAQPRRERRKSGLRNEVTDGMPMGEKMENWSREKWAQMGLYYRSRALSHKRYGDAYCGRSRYPEYQSIEFDNLKGLLCLTDSILLWHYAYFCEEQSAGRVKARAYDESRQLRVWVREEWNKEKAKKREAGEDDERPRAMVGLLYLLDAIICFHIGEDSLSALHRRGKELSTALTPPNDGLSPPVSVDSPSHPTPTQAPAQIHPSGSHNPSQSQPHTTTNPSPPSSHSPHSPSSSTSYSLPPDLLPLISVSTAASSTATQNLLTSRHLLPLSSLRSSFPDTYSLAIHSELNPLPPPGDKLGSAKEVDVENPEKFCWPIELGMVAPVAHVVSFGRSMVREMAEREGREWSMVLEAREAV
ncbi:hypothetical protein IAT38_001100 [Cryptococcus sp. DSM 104549]